MNSCVNYLGSITSSLLLVIAVPIISPVGMLPSLTAQAQTNQNEELLQGLQLLTKGNEQINQGKPKAALKSFQEALKFFQESNYTVGIGTSLTGIGRVYNELGNYSQALVFYQQALQIFQDSNNQAGIGSTFSNIGTIYASTGDYPQALKHYNQSLEIFQKLSNSFIPGTKIQPGQIDPRQGKGTALNNLGEIHDTLGQYDQALNFYQQASEVYKVIQDKEGIGVALNNIAAIYVAKGDYAESLKYFQPALQIRKQAGDLPKIGRTLNNMAVAYSYLGNNRKALDFYQQALEIRRKIKDIQGESRTLNNIGEEYRVLKEYSQALPYYRQALDIHLKAGDKRGQGIVLNNIGATYFYMGEYAKATKTLLQAIAFFESLRSGLNDAHKISISDTQASAYLFLQASLVAQKKTNMALEVAERGRARAFIDLLAAQKSGKTKPQITIKPSSIQEIQQIAKVQNATLVEYSILGNSLYIWVIQPTGKIAFKDIDLKSLSVPFKKLIPQARKSLNVRSPVVSQGKKQTFVPGDLVKLKTDPPANEPWQVVSVDPKTGNLKLTQRSFANSGITFEHPPSDVLRQVVSPNSKYRELQALHQVLITPISEFLPTSPQSRVIFIPQGELFLIPFPALQDTQGKYLIEKHTILTAPAIQVLDLTRQQQQRLRIANSPKPQKKQDVLVVGNPLMPKLPAKPGKTPEILSPLPNAEAEAKAIAQLLQTQALIGKQATKARVLERMPTARIIHLATHGLLNEVKGLKSEIALAPSANDNGFLSAAEILNLQLQAELVILSACNTGKGRITGDGIIGLSRSFIAAGTPSIIVSLWTVPDAPTAKLMTEFYQQLQRQPDRSQALRQAMLQIMKTHPEPTDWAAFTLIGEAL